MPLHTILFAISLVILSAFFALKEREVYSGSTTLVTRAFKHLSPTAERLWRTLLSIALRHAHRLAIIAVSSAARIAERSLVTLRYVIVVLAEKMIKGVKGERLLSMRGAPSMYLKHLKEHKDANGAPSDTSA